MNTKLNKELKMILAGIALANSPFGTRWYSGSKRFEAGLLAKGVQLPEHLYYKYILPGNTEPGRYMRKLALYSFYKDYDVWGYRVLDDAQIQQDKKDLLVNEIRSKQKEYTQRLLDDAVELLKLNPNLRHLSVNSENAFDILAGATFWYLPRNIEYFIDYKNRDINREQEVSNKIKTYGVKESCGILAPEIADMIISALEKNKQSIYVSTSKRQSHGKIL